jgi:hypothetical protein
MQRLVSLIVFLTPDHNFNKHNNINMNLLVFVKKFFFFVGHTCDDVICKNVI